MVGSVGVGGAEQADQGSFNMSGFVEDEGPAWRSAMVTGPGVDDAYMMDEDDSEPVYRSLGLDDAEAVPLPGLKRQAAFSRLQM